MCVRAQAQSGRAGVHRVQRVPKTESLGRVHTSTGATRCVSVFGQSTFLRRAERLCLLSSSNGRRVARGYGGDVGGRRSDLRLIDAQTDVVISPNDLRIDVFRSSGAGGQSVNTVRLRRRRCFCSVHFFVWHRPTVRCASLTCRPALPSRCKTNVHSFRFD